jgi:ATP-dependent helicase/DNAse subunit B
MVKHAETKESTGERLKGTVTVGKKATLRQFENVTANLMIEFYRDESNPLEESKKLMEFIDSIIIMAKSRWT